MERHRLCDVLSLGCGQVCTSIWLFLERKLPQDCQFEQARILTCYIRCVLKWRCAWLGGHDRRNKVSSLLHGSRFQSRTDEARPALRPEVQPRYIQVFCDFNGRNCSTSVLYSKCGKQINSQIYPKLSQTKSKLSTSSIGSDNTTCNCNAVRSGEPWYEPTIWLVASHRCHPC